MAYCLDTSSLLEAWRRSYPPTVFAGLWDRLDELIHDGRLWSSVEVLRELEKRDDDVYEWASERSSIFLPIDDGIQQAVLKVLESHPRLMGARANRNHADPFVIATATDKELAVVTEENNGKQEKPRIPDVCEHYGLPCSKVLAMIQQEGWVF